MTQIKKLSDSDLLMAVKSSVTHERNLLVQILQYLKEIESRKLHLQRGFSSLFAFCVEHLGYEESQAQRRISAMRLTREIPEIESKIENGSLSLTAVTQAQSFFRKEALNEKPMTSLEKKEVLSLLENKSVRACEKELMKLNPEFLPYRAEKTRMLSEDLSEVKIVLENKTLEKLNKLKNMLSNRNPHMSLQSLIDLLADEGLKKFDPEVKAQNKKRSVQISALPSAPKVSSEGNIRYQSQGTDQIQNKFTGTRRHVPVHLRRQVWLRDKGQCTFTDPLTGKKCDSQFKLHLDHIQPWAVGGCHSLENLRLLCAEHNNLWAVRFYGKKKMEQYFGTNLC